MHTGGLGPTTMIDVSRDGIHMIPTTILPVTTWFCRTSSGDAEINVSCYIIDTKAKHTQASSPGYSQLYKMSEVVLR